MNKQENKHDSNQMEEQETQNQTRTEMINCADQRGTKEMVVAKKISFIDNSNNITTTKQQQKRLK